MFSLFFSAREAVLSSGSVREAVLSFVLAREAVLSFVLAREAGHLCARVAGRVANIGGGRKAPGSQKAPGSLLLLLLAALVAGASFAAGPVGISKPDEVDASIERGLEFLAANQKEDGSFPGKYGDTTAIPALAAMACLAKGYTPGDAKYGPTIYRSIDYILAHADETGYYGKIGDGKMYAHSISTLFLAEVSGMVDPARQQKIDKALPIAIKIILDAQNIKKGEREAGGWRYTPDTRESDTSCSGWALMALRSARLNGARIPGTAILRAVEYMHKHHSKEQGSFGYQDGERYSVTLSGAGILCLELCGRHNDPDSLSAARYLVKVYQDEMPKQEYKFYGMYYASQGLFQIGGDDWKNFSDWMYRTWIPKQGADGAWRGNSGEDSPAYSTAMMLLAFAVPYRQLPIYQRDETVDETT